MFFFFLLEYSEEMISWTPSHDALEDLCHRIGNATFKLGIELELNIVTLQSIEKNNKELPDQTREVLKNWISKKGSNEQINYPFQTLAKSLMRVGKFGSIQILEDHFKECSQQQQK